MMMIVKDDDIDRGIMFLMILMTTMSMTINSLSKKNDDDDDDDVIKIDGDDNKFNDYGGKDPDGKLK